MNPPHQDHPNPTLKLAVVLPALNEESTVGQVIAAVPRRLPGIGQVEVILVDDGSTDATVLRALAAGADRIARHARNRGLVAAFSRGITEALHAGADIVVHLDSDGQHDPARIPQLIAPIVAGEADIVVGVRPLAHASDMTLGKRLGNRFGSWVFRRLLKLPVSDFTSGYRALSREALLRLNLVSDYTYTLESLIQAARMRLAVAEVVVPVRRRSVGDSRMAGSAIVRSRCCAHDARGPFLYRLVPLGLSIGRAPSTRVARGSSRLRDEHRAVRLRPSRRRHRLEPTTTRRPAVSDEGTRSTQRHRCCRYS